MCRQICIGFIDFMLNGKSLLDYTNLFSSNEYEKNDKMILTVILKMKKCIALYVVSIKNLKNLKYHTSQKKHQFFILFIASVTLNMNKHSNKRIN